MKKTVSKAEHIRAALTKQPNMSKSKLAKTLKVSPAYVYSVVAKMDKAEAKKEEPLFGRKGEPKVETPKVETPKATGTDAMLAERGSRYGKFTGHAKVTQILKNVLSAHAKSVGTEFAFDQAEALDMICHKLGRIVNGDPDYGDSWRDIEGYSKLVADRLEKGVEV